MGNEVNSIGAANGSATGQGIGPQVSSTAQSTMQQFLQGFAMAKPAVDSLVLLTTGNSVNPQDAVNALYNCNNAYLAWMAKQNANVPQPTQQPSPQIPAPAAGSNK